MMTQLYCSISATPAPQLLAVGGKALSLIKLKAAGFPVPQGFILTVDFFRPWLQQIESGAVWNDFAANPGTDITGSCNALIAACLALEFSKEQKEAVRSGLRLFPDFAGTWAVRSSAPEEDGENASFAGEFKTLLGVQKDTLEQAVREVFAAVFDERVFLYKREHGFDMALPRLAVIVQELVNAAAAGVAFSLNPLNNCYDEAVINANFGLGETVVSGTVSPDTFIVDKVKKQILEKTPGKKETALRVAEDGLVRREAFRAEEVFCLEEPEVLQLAEMAAAVERLYEKPVDMEWALGDKRQIYLLQARPVTAYFPLPREMQTEPGAPKRLYLDAILTKQGIQHPLSVLGVDYYDLITRLLLGQSFEVRRQKDPVDSTLALIIHGRTYVNLSNRLRISKKEKFAEEYRIVDPLTAETVAALDEKEYRARKLPLRMFRLPLKTVIQGFSMIRNIGKAMKAPGKYKEFVRENIALFIKEISDRSLDRLPVNAHIKKTSGRLIDFLFRITIPFTYACLIAKPALVKLFKKISPEAAAMAENVDRSMPENITIEMGVALYRLSRFPVIHGMASEEEFLEKLQARSLAPDFLAAWDNFMEQYGFRGPGEIDIAAARYRDTPQLIYRQLTAMAANNTGTGNPEDVYRKAQAERVNAYEKLQEAASKAGKKTLKKFERYYQVLLQFGGWRESHKYYMVMLNYKIRQRALFMGTQWVKAGKLDNPVQIFDLNLDDLEQACTDQAFDLRAQAAANTAYRKLYRHIREYPRVIDSRGKILRPPVKKGKPGQIIGTPISPGKVTGSVKVLNTPGEKPLLPGEILVARATDPGWTPLFVNAAGIILEIGGTLQHGACVAREYGKPCVSGLENATEIFRDGQLVELDGSNGIITLSGETMG